MPGAGSNRINEFGFYTNYYTLPVAQEIELPRVIFKHDLGDGEADVLIGRKR